MPDEQRSPEPWEPPAGSTQLCRLQTENPNVIGNGRENSEGPTARKSQGDVASYRV